MRANLILGLALTALVAACGSSSPAPGGKDGGAGAGTAGASASGGASGASGAAGVSGGAGSSGSAGANGAAGASGTGGGSGGQPIGSVCANTGNCSQADGAAVCCVNTCVLQGQCPTGNQFLACTGAADCAKYGGGKVCCQAPGMSFCTKPSGCSGTTLP